ncbi:SNase-domain-containing protein [Sodiomyces alkalinus F11]|uniref:Probable endonuclease LCL3 n=1 Tax=Sodiomyces alkalinus (strain CBS 110278 / VKM F-3762 / F11) TaxID=1314773 RepID=A0A3N2PRW4_SODAK|nr:SNase-domain-containing protein [Sodiomyces alkalinus F11]ROT37251.1 SNase-domain-containing protein [Sodiomyces alkalinus F11]
MPWPWPFGSSGSSDKSNLSKKSKEEKDESPPGSPPSWNDLLPKPDPPLQAAKEWTPVFLTAVGSLAVFVFYQSYLKRIPSAGSIQDNYFRRRSLFGKVTSVGDGDGFHLFHTPGGRLAGWGWLRKVPETRSALKGKTIPVRLAGVDAPEGAYFGQPGQPFAQEARAYLSDCILNRRVRAYIHSRDQYNRVVATVYVRGFPFRKDVGLPLLKQGLATTYEAKSGVEWGGMEKVYKAAELKARAKRLGIWSAKPSDFVSPRSYKKEKQGQQQEKQREVEEQTEKSRWWKWF